MAMSALIGKMFGSEKAIGAAVSGISNSLDGRYTPTRRAGRGGRATRLDPGYRLDAGHQWAGASQKVDCGIHYVYG